MHANTQHHKKQVVDSLTSVYPRGKGQVAGLRVEGELVDVHPAGADDHLGISNNDFSIRVEADVRV